ncbi:MAG: nucleoside 2-deoxyribosyltransferase [Candidatus Aegiribacteria sp.]|nr:nucleoside 2-deoxyribosyltransferase [Candidatus Aegiribacteria sp.]
MRMKKERVGSLPQVYIAAPLFSVNDRLAAASLCDAVVREISSRQNVSVSLARDSVFLPYCDTKQDEIIGTNRARSIFVKDIERLDWATHVIARMDGMPKDSGVAFELGYARAKGDFCATLSTDFVWDGTISGESVVEDPILTSAGVFCHRHYQLPVRDSYTERNKALEEYALLEFVKELDWKQKAGESLSIDMHDVVCRVFVDCFGGRFEWSQDFYKKCSRVKNVRMAERWLFNQSSLIAQHARNDLALAVSAEAAVFVGDGLEMDTGSAFLMGVCYGLGKPLIFQYTSNIQTCGDGGQAMRVNLMLEQAATVVTSTSAETLRELSNFSL